MMKISQREYFKYHPLIGYLYIPNIKARIQHESGRYLVKTNNLGFRSNRNIEITKEKDKFRVLLLGDSCTAGNGVSNSDRFGDIIESELDEVEVVNLGMPGTGADQQYLIFKEIGKFIEHDLVIICPYVENIRRNASRCWLIENKKENCFDVYPTPYFMLQDDGSIVHYNNPVPKKYKVEKGDPKFTELLLHGNRGGRFPIFSKIFNSRLLFMKDLVQKLTRYQPYPEYNDPNRKEWKLTKSIFKTLILESKKKVVVCPLPSYQYIEGLSNANYYRKRFEELTTDFGVEVVDLLPEYHKLSKEDRRRCRFPNDQHPSPFGHKIIADTLKICIMKHLKIWRNNEK